MEQVNKQGLCATPTGGCRIFRLPFSCQEWHGCTWDRARRGCIYDGTCSNGKPRRTPAPTTAVPTSSPTIKCNIPSKGCAAVSVSDCARFNGCIVDKGRCAPGGCQPTRSPTPAPTVCIDVPSEPTGCASKTSLRACEQWTCCTWMDAQHICEFTPATPAPIPSRAPTKRPTPRRRSG